MQYAHPAEGSARTTPPARECWFSLKSVLFRRLVQFMQTPKAFANCSRPTRRNAESVGYTDVRRTTRQRFQRLSVFLTSLPRIETILGCNWRTPSAFA
jgi:hypothetical protein